MMLKLFHINMMLLEYIDDQRRINTVKIVIGAQSLSKITIFD